VIYELHVGTFSSEGTFEGVIDKLDHLATLGINAVELMPVNEFPGARGWGYDGVDLYAPHHAYGGPEGLKRLVDACHARGLAVVLDVVYNHLGPAGNYLREFGPYFTDKYGTPWGEAVNLDERGSPEVRNFFIDNALGWFENYHVDGLRLDAIHAIYDQSAVHFLEEMSTRVDALEGMGRNLWLIAESDLNDPRIVRPREAGGYGIDAQWSDDLHHSLHAAITGERTGYYSDFGAVADIAKALQHAFVYDGRLSGFRQRIHGRPTAGLDGHRFLGYLQTHDQVGNRARGDRTSALISNDLLKVGAALVMTSPFVPMLFQGEEWGATTPFLYFTDHDDPELGRAVRDGRRREFAGFGWNPEDIPDPQDLATFEHSKLDWAELNDQPHADLLEWHKRLIRLRREWPELSDGRMNDVQTRFDEEERWIVITRGPVEVAANLSKERARVPAASAKVLLSSTKEPVATGDYLELEPESVVIYQRPTA
jgi:maltooligosyltrehalose trehalohydrolase